MKRFWNSSGVRFVREMWSIYFSKRLDISAAALAYFLILSFFPLLICVNAFVGLLQVQSQSVLTALRPFLPPRLLVVVGEYLGYITNNGSTALLVVGGIMTLFFASGAVRGLMDAMDEIYGRRGYNGFWRLVASVGFSLALLGTICLSMVVVLTGTWFLQLLERYLPLGWLQGVWSWQWLKFPLLFAVVFFLVAAVYRMTAPPGKPRPPVFLGAFLASVALVVASWIFSLFIGLSSHYSLIYGSLASVAILLLWLYLCASVLILGNVFNCVRYDRKKKK